ncbi:hypothetical protein PFLmoz3_04217 [Pseudomonas fluorescens]|uniref:Uncharacterized protein n=1 Tax=Pseudomonas fluorescens TaxID=294 RepID=A0A109LEV7_PSEFL|nr:hypothetical protein PFLmoz3_04217 [Pseudomonas fluorescens]
MNAASTCASSPCTSEGSSKPQCVFTAGPKYTGHASPAALSHTVMTTSGGLPSKASLPLLYKPSMLMPAACSVLRLRGNTWPLGKLPALIASKPGGARWLNIASDKMLRQLLAVHMNSTFIAVSFRCSGATRGRRG